MSEMKVLIDALPFITFSDRAVGKRFKESLERLDEDMTDEEYEPSPEAAASYAKLAEEIEDATELAENPVATPEKDELPVITEAELPAEELVAEELPEVALDPEDEDATES